jgi:hypothetical protein
MALDTGADYVARARVVLLDTIVPFRYPDEDLVEALNEGILEGRKLRPDLFVGFFRTALPDYNIDTQTSLVPIDPAYRVAFMYYICGATQLRDEENTQDSRAVAFLQKFSTALLGMS